MPAPLLWALAFSQNLGEHPSLGCRRPAELKGPQSFWVRPQTDSFENSLKIQIYFCFPPFWGDTIMGEAGRGP